jgi:hypothetical protein
MIVYDVKNTVDSSQPFITYKCVLPCTSLHLCRHLSQTKSKTNSPNFNKDSRNFQKFRSRPPISRTLLRPLRSSSRTIRELHRSQAHGNTQSFASMSNLNASIRLFDPDPDIKYLVKHINTRTNSCPGNSSLFFVAGVKPLFAYSESIGSRAVQTNPCISEILTRLHVYTARRLLIEYIIIRSSILNAVPDFSRFFTIYLDF